MKRHLYKISSPAGHQPSIALSDEYFVPNNPGGLKVAAFLDTASLPQRVDLFKHADAKETRDLAKAYNAMCGKTVASTIKEEAAVADDDDDDDYGQDAFDLVDDDDDDE